MTKLECDIDYYWYAFPSTLFYIVMDIYNTGGIDFAPTWINNHTPSLLWGKLLIHTQTSMVQPLKFENGLIILSYTL